MISAIRQPSYFLSSGLLKPITAWLECDGSHVPVRVISATIRPRVTGSRRLASSLPPSDAHEGKHEFSPFPLAEYGYIVAATSRPEARAESILWIISGA